MGHEITRRDAIKAAIAAGVGLAAAPAVSATVDLLPAPTEDATWGAYWTIWGSIERTIARYGLGDDLKLRGITYQGNLVKAYFEARRDGRMQELTGFAGVSLAEMPWIAPAVGACLVDAAASAMGIWPEVVARLLDGLGRPDTDTDTDTGGDAS